MIDHFLAHSNQAGEGLELLPGVLPLLNALAARPDVAVCLVTGNLEPIGWAKMDALGVRHLFTAPNFGGFSTDYCNPENLEQSWRDRAEFVRIAARKLTEQQSDCDIKARYHVGDAPMDVQAAVGGGAKAVGVCTGIYTRQELCDAAPEAVVLEDLTDLAAAGPAAMALHQDCRFYESKFPEVDDVVMVQVRSIAEMGAYVSLLEYGGIEGMILLSELSRRRIRSVQKLIKVGRQEPVMVLRVDEEKGYIDLSKRRVSPEDLQKCEERFAKSKMVHSIMRHVAETTGQNLEQLYTDIAWPLYRMYGHAHTAFSTMVTDAESDAVFKRLIDEVHGGTVPEVLTPAVKDGILVNVRRRLTPQPIKVRADVEMTCFAYDGVEKIKDAMRAAQACSTEACLISMKLVAAPRYVLTTHTLDKAQGIEVLTKAVEECKAHLEAEKGRLVVKEAARAVSEKEERALEEELQAAEAANREVSGDTDEDEDFEEGQNVDVDAGPALATVAASTSFSRVALARPQAVRTVAVRAVVCRAQQQNIAAKAAAAAVSLPALLAAHPALALVDNRLNGDGTGRILGINDPSLFWVIAGVFTLIWAIYYRSTRDVDGGDNDEDFGLKL
ncbi:Eukaryotic translation initiation factor 2 subunit alpha [Chlorella vulgaris]